MFDEKITKRYIELMEDENKTYEDVQNFIHVNRPNCLYRYRTVEFIESETIGGLIKISQPSVYNDLFDCGFYIDSEKYMNDRKWICNQNLLFMGNTADMKEMFQKSINKIELEYKEENYFTCFSEENNNPLMWAHYADSHKGICIEYDYDKIPKEIKRLIFSIIYKEKRYDATQLLAYHNKNLARNPSFYKSSMWRYEKEWRFRIDRTEIDSIKNKSVKEINSGSHIFLELSSTIKSIYFGMNFNFNNKEITEYLKKTSETC